jgi:cell division protease FtsH
MVREFGLSPAVGPVGYPRGGSVYLDGGSPPVSSRPYAESTQAVIDREVSRLLREAEEHATELLRTHQSELDQLADILIEEETVDAETVYRLFGMSPPENRDEPAAVLAPHRATADGPAPPRPAESPGPS